NDVRSQMSAAERHQCVEAMHRLLCAVQPKAEALEKMPMLSLSPQLGSYVRHRRTTAVQMAPNSRHRKTRVRATWQTFDKRDFQSQHRAVCPDKSMANRFYCSFPKYIGL